jgi:hypothetical protein
MSKMLKGLGSGGLGIASVLVFFVLPLALLFNAGVLAGWFEKLIVPACIICEWVIVICLFVLLPLAIFRWTRGFAASGLMLASFAFGVTTWMASFSITYYYWGVVGVVIGLVIAGVGVLPIAVIASLIYADWTTVGLLILGAALIFGSRMFAAWLFTTLEREPVKKAPAIPPNVAQVFD